MLLVYGVIWYLVLLEYAEVNDDVYFFFGTSFIPQKNISIDRLFYL